jgi:hypothetical protein
MNADLGGESVRKRFLGKQSRSWEDNGVPEDRRL